MHLCADRFNPLLFQPHPQLLKGLQNVEGARKGKVTTVEVKQSTYTVRLHSGKQPDSPFAAELKRFACWNAFFILVYFN